jgi:hypothetical protein
MGLRTQSTMTGLVATRITDVKHTLRDSHLTGKNWGWSRADFSSMSWNAEWKRQSVAARR